MNMRSDKRRGRIPDRSTAVQVRPTKCSTLLSGQDKLIKTLPTKRVASIGKAKGKGSRHMHCMDHFPLQGLDMVKKQKLSLMAQHSFYLADLKDLKIHTNSGPKERFVFDGLEECLLHLDFPCTPKHCDVSELTSVDVILTNLVMRSQLLSALLWITTQPAAASKISPECVNQVKEIKGLDDQQKEDNLRRSLQDKPKESIRFATK